MIKSDSRKVTTFPRIPVLLLGLSAGLIGFAASEASAQTIITKANTATMSSAADWGGTAPTNTTIGLFDSTISAANESALSLTANTTLAGITFASTLNGPVTLGSGNTLILDSSLYSGAAGIDLHAANQSVTINSALALKGRQMWNVPAGKTLTIGVGPSAGAAGVDFTNFQGTLGGLGDDATGILGTWATIDTTNYAAVSGGVVSLYTGTPAATAGDVSDTSGTVNYDVSGVGALAGNSFNTLRYLGAAGTISGAFTVNGLMSAGTGAPTYSGGITVGASGTLTVSGNTNLVLTGAIADGASASGFTYNGTGTLTLGVSGANVADNSSTFTGDFVANSGTISVLKTENINASSGVNSSPLGNRTVARNIIVNSGAVISFDGANGNELGRGAGPTAPAMTTVVNRGGVVRATASNRTFGPIVLNGGTISITGASGSASYLPIGLGGDVTVSGNSPSVIVSTATGTGTGVNLTALAAGQRSFSVADVTGDANVDLTVSAILGNSVGAGAAAGLIKGGSGTMMLPMANIYTGVTTITNGIITTGAGGSLANGGTASSIGQAANAAANLVFNNGTLQYSSTNPPASSDHLFTIGMGVAGASATLDASGSNPIRFSNAGALAYGTANLTRGLILTGSNTGTNTFSPLVADNGTGATSLTKNGAGLWLLTGANTFTGGTVINGGTLQAGNANGLALGSGSVTVNAGGALAGIVTNPASVTYNTGAEAVFNLGANGLSLTNDHITLTGAGSVLTCNGVNVGIRCGASLDSVHNYVLFNLSNGGSVSGSFNATPAWLATVPANAGSYAIATVGSQVVLRYTGAAVPVITTTNAAPNPVLRSQALTLSVSVTPGAGSITSVVVDTTAIGGSSAFALVPDGAGNYTNTLVVSSTTLAGAKVLNVTVTDSNNSLAVTTINLTVGSTLEVWDGLGADANWTTALNWAGIGGAPLNGDAVVFAGNTALTPVMNNSYSLGSLTFTNNAASFTVNNTAGSVLTLTGGLTNSSANPETFNAPIVLGSALTISAAAGDLTLGQNITNGGNALTIGDGGHNTIVSGAVSGTGALTKAGSGTNTLTGVNTFSGNITISAGQLAVAGAGQLNSGAYAGTIANASAFSYGSSAAQTLSGVISGAGTVNESGPGGLTLTAANTYTGPTKIAGGSVIIGGAGILTNGGIASAIGQSANLAANLVFDSGTLKYASTVASTISDRLLTIGQSTAGASATIDASGTGPVGFTNSGALAYGTANQTRSLILTGTNAAANTFGPWIADNGSGAMAVTKSGTGSWILPNTNTYSGATTISGGVLSTGAGGSLTNGGVASSIGAGANVAASLVLDGGMLKYASTNKAASSDRLFTLTANGGALDASGANTLTLAGSGANAIAYLGSGTRTLTLTGTNTSANALAPVLADGPGGATALVKTGPGTWAISGANTFSGGTIISNGMLRVSNPGGSGTGSGNVTVNTNGMLGGTGTVAGSVTVNAGGFTRPSFTNTLAGAPITINGNVTYNAGAEADFTLSSTYNGHNDQVVLNGAGSVLTCDGVNVGINCGSVLDSSGHDYVLFNLTGGAATIPDSFNSSPIWLGTVPVNSYLYQVETVGSQVLLHYAGQVLPIVTTTNVTPNPAFRNQIVRFSVSVTPGAGAIDPNSGVSVDVSPISPSGSLSLIYDGAGHYTNSVLVDPGTLPGNDSLNVTVNDSNGNSVPAVIALTIGTFVDVWDGAGANNFWSTVNNWTGGNAPLGGDAVTFAGTRRLTPDMDAYYSLQSIVFSNNAGSFNLGSSSSSVLTLSGGVTNNATVAETLAGYLAFSQPVTVNAAAGNLVIGSASDSIDDGGFLFDITDGGSQTTVAGDLMGTGGVVKDGPGTAVLRGNNSYTGGTSINNGTLLVADPGQLGNGVYTAGITNNGLLAFNSSAAQTLSGVVSGAGGLNLFGPGTITLDPNPTANAVSDTGNSFAGNVLITNGTVSVTKVVNITGAQTSGLGNPRLAGRTVTINNGGILSFDASSELGRGAEIPLLSIIVNAGGTLQGTSANRTVTNVTLNGSTMLVNGNSISNYAAFGLGGSIIAGGASPSSISGSGAVNLTVSGNTQTTFNVADATGDTNADLIVSVPLLNTVSSLAASGLVKTGVGTLALTAGNYYTGPTTVSNGVLLLNNTIGSGTGSNNVVTVAGGTLGGIGSLASSVVVQSGGQLAPGIASAPGATLTVSTNVQLAAGSLTTLNVLRSGNLNDKVLQTGGTLSYGGTLTVVNYGGTFNLGDRLQLFSAPAYAGGFSVLNLPPLAPGLAWSNQLLANGSIVVVTAPTAPPSLGIATITGGNMVFTGTNGLAGQQYRILTTTNLSSGLGNWIPVLTNTFAADGGYTNSLPVNVAQPAGFFRLVTP